MNRVLALLLVILFILLLSNQITIFNVLKTEKKENAIISSVTDGDTVKLADGRIVRLVNINAPEKNIPLSSKSAEFVRSFENKTVTLDIIGSDKYGRVLARIYTPDYLNARLVELGLASKFLVQESELEYFAELEEQAIESQEGIWKHSPNWGCFLFSVDQEDEIIEIYNACTVQLAGFTLKDESRKIYKFPSTNISKLKLHTFNGSNNATDLFWQSKKSIWNDDRDSIYLFDAQNYIVGYYSYGYS